jgi:acyl carrier protein
MDQTQSGANGGPVFQDLVTLIEDMTDDWETGFTGGLKPETRIMADLGFESIDVVHLIIAIEEHYKREDLEFEKLLMHEGRYVDDLTLRELADFLGSHLTASS